MTSTSPLNAALSYARQTHLANNPLSPVDDSVKPGGGDSFSDLLGKAVSAVENKGRASDQTAMAFTEGKSDLLSLVTAVNESEMAIETLVNVRDRMISAYQEIMRMPI